MITLLHNETVRLRAPEPEDLEVMFELENNAELQEFGGATGPYSRYHLKKYIEESANDLFVDGQLRLMIEDRRGRLAGIIDLFDFNARHLRAEVGIVVRKEFRRQGIARAALQLVGEHCFRFLGIHQLYAYIHCDNRPCLDLFARSGFRVTGTLSDWVYAGGRYKTVCIVQKCMPEVQFSDGNIG